MSRFARFFRVLFEVPQGSEGVPLGLEGGFQCPEGGFPGLLKWCPRVSEGGPFTPHVFLRLQKLSGLLLFGNWWFLVSI